ncbi:MAG: hypothetical protein ACUVSE_07395 [Armatimonadota bacterium]
MPTANTLAMSAEHRGQRQILFRFAHLLAALWFAGVSCTVFWRVVLRGEVLYYGDIMLYFHPVLAFEHRWLSQGILPLWNPHTLFGQPFIGNPQEWLLYPSTLLVAWLGAERAISWGAVIHLWLAGLGTYAFALRRQYPPRTAIAAGTLWMLCGAVTLRSQHVGILQTLAWYGWSFWAVEGLLQKANPGRAFALAAVLALASLAGSPQMFHMLLLTLLAWTIYRWREVEDKRRTLGWGAAAGTIAFSVGGVHWLPLTEFLRYTDRDHLSLLDSARYALHLHHLLLLLVPNLFGFPWKGNYALTLFYWELAFFVGTVPCVAVLARWRRAQADERFWKWTVILSLWLAIGPYGGLYWLAYYLVPGMQSFRTPLRWTTITDFALCLWAVSALGQVQMDKRWWRLPVAMLVLAGIWQALGDDIARSLAPDRAMLAKALLMAEGIRSALWRATAMCAVAVALLCQRQRWRWALASVVTMAELLWIATPANPTCSPEVFSAPPQSANELLQTGQRLFVPGTSAIWLNYVNAHDYGSSETSRLRAWRETLASNIGMAHGVSEASGYEPAPLRESLRRFNELQTVWRKAPNALRKAGVGMIATGETAESWKLVPTPIAGARAWMRETDLAVSWRQVSPQRVALFPPHAGELILADSAYPGWQVLIDGKPAPWRVYDRAFRVVNIPPGVQSVEWRYAPDTFRVGLFLSCIGIACLSAIAGYALASRSSAHGHF